MDNRQPWLNSKWSDIFFILSPAFISLLLVVLFPAQFQKSVGIPVAYWVFLILFIDVAHVYSTLYRTYFNSENFKNQKTLLLSVPLVCYIFGIIIYKFDALWFWRLLAYLAVYHFIRQQYGFMRLYSRTEKTSKAVKLIDQVAIYTATIYPLIFWHLSPGRNFNWFVEGDFLSFENDFLLHYATILYVAIISVYVLKETISCMKNKWVNVPRNLIIIGTFLSWYFGIVYFNGDMAFTTLNVISHGIPYMALIWFFEKKKNHNLSLKSKICSLCFDKFGIVYFVMILLVFAYLEEGLWDGMVWREHQSVFKPFVFLPYLNSNNALMLIVPLLSLPQSTHYVLDGFIWKSKNKF
ncbi:hypothetical protein [Pedobacter frigidisoli]|uniref:hypothetical protein n=1 Tax=Pedobacter frigidisoli TaxID=2530455 RepID=UPI0029301835|nr:hypothetical protein [Pedobacter frigidisoli]